MNVHLRPTSSCPAGRERDNADGTDGTLLCCCHTEPGASVSAGVCLETVLPDGSCPNLNRAERVGP